MSLPNNNSRQKFVEKLLNDCSHHIEFNGHLTNHNKHAVIALERLGATEQRIQAYYEGYAQCTPYGFGLELPRKSKYVITLDNWQQFLGKRTSYSSYYDFFDAEERRLGKKLFLEQYISLLIDGWASALTHAAIHLGWALDIGNRCMMIEGVSYLAFSFISCHPERTQVRNSMMSDHLSAAQSLFYIADQWQNDSNALHNWVVELVDMDKDNSSDVHPELRRSGLQYKVAQLLKTGHPLIYNLPAWLVNNGIDTVWKQLRHCVTLIFLNEPGDFLLLHLITALHGMEEIAHALPQPLQYHVAKNFWIGFLCILFCRGTFPDKVALENLHAIYHQQVNEDLVAANLDWQEIVERAIAEEEEHNPKMVYVLKKWWQESGFQTSYHAAATVFTTTPELPKSFEIPVTL